MAEVTHRPVATVLAEELDEWPVESAAVAVVGESRVVVSRGPERIHRWASITKVLTALVVLRGVERGVLDLDAPAGPPGSTLRHLLAHASGLAFDSDRVLSPPGRRRIYSNRGIELAAEHVTEVAGLSFDELLDMWVLRPLGMRSTVLDGSPAAGARGPVEDLARLAGQLLHPRELPTDLLSQFTTTAFPGLSGVLPGFGRQEPNDWGLGFEVRSRKSPHWSGTQTSPATFGHFGQSGSFLWVDPDAGLAGVGVCDTDFGPWAAELWPRLADRVLASVAAVPTRF